MTGMVPCPVPNLRASIAVALAALCWSPTAALAQAPANPAPPIVATGDAAEISETAAVLTGTVDAQGADATVRFDYGTTAGYGLRSVTAVVPAAGGPTAIRLPITRLTAGTSYHARITATNAAGTVRGSDRAFSTVAIARAPSVQTSSAIARTPGGATLVARVDPRGQATSVYFEYGSSASYGLRTAEQTVPASSAVTSVQIPLTGLSSNSTYAFRAVAVNATGTARGSQHTFRTTRGVSAVSVRLAQRQIEWSRTARITGKVEGLSVRGVQVKLWRQDHPFSGPFVEVGSMIASDEGTYAFTSPKLYWATRFRVTVDTPAGVSSATTTTTGGLRIKLRSTGKRSGSVELRGLVYPGVAKGRVVIQRRSPTGRWITARRASLAKSASVNRSSFRARVPRLSTRTASYRAVVTPIDGGAHAVTTTGSISVPRR